MPAWVLPACAAGCWFGVRAGARIPPALGAVLVLVALGVVAAVLLAARSGAPPSARLLDATGLATPGRAPLDERARILAAAGFGAGRSLVARWPPRAMAIVVIGVGAAAAGWGSVHASARDLGPLDGRYVAFSGRAVSDLKRTAWGWALEADVTSLTLDGRTWPVELRTWMSGEERALKAEAGQVLRGLGRIEGLGSSGGFSAYLASKGVMAQLHASSIRVASGTEPAPLAAANAVRRAFREGISRALPARNGALLLGLAVGDTTRLDPEVEEDFRASGLGHLLAVSGSNVAVFLAPVLALASRFRVRPSGRLAIGAGAVIFFALITRWEPSVIRASAMATIALAGVAAGRPRSTMSALAAAVLLLLVADPRLAGSLGFELSVAATAGLAAMASPIALRLGWLPRPVALAVAATLAAQLAVTPLLLLRFGVVPTVTVLANVLAFAAVAPALLIGVPAAAIALPWPVAGSALGRVAAVPLDYLLWVADRTAAFPLPSVTSRGAWIPLGTAALVGVAGWRLRRGRRPVAAVIGLAVLAALAWTTPSAPRPASLTATFLDVGQGDAAVVRSPGGATILIDAGPDEQQVATELARLGVHRLDLAVASHAHADHIAGFPAVLARFPISLLLDPGCPAESPVYAGFLDAVRAEEVRIEHPRGGDRYLVGDVVVEVLGPDSCGSPEEPNDDSIVLRLALGSDSILFPGDAEVGAQRDLLDDGDPIEADVLKVPHHGGDTSDPAFLVAIGAAAAILSAGPNAYGHPHPAVVEVLDGAGMSVHRTDRSGPLAVWFTPGGAVVVGSPA